MSLFGKQKDGSNAGAPVPAGPVSNEPRAAHTSEASGAPRPSHGEGNQQMANIGKSITIRGDLSGNEDLVIEGTVDGKVELPDNQLTVGADGAVRAEISAKSVVVVGKVTGNIRGSERIEIQATGSVEGDVSAPRLIVAEGAVLNGAIEMGASGGKAPAKVEPAKATDERKAG